LTRVIPVSGLSDPSVSFADSSLSAREPFVGRTPYILPLEGGNAPVVRCRTARNERWMRWPSCAFGAYRVREANISRKT
ncbi:MAG: hypothetical protein IJM18_04125, partial [Clostridia bacterium]|nr:hypothetical protein [Clostridia bacterium]